MLTNRKLGSDSVSSIEISEYFAHIVRFLNYILQFLRSNSLRLLSSLMYIIPLIALMLLTAASAQAQKRNILLLIGDDIGIDVAEFYPTPDRRVTTSSMPPMPNLKQLAQVGVLFRNTWANPLCSPTRATIFTGRYGFRTGLGNNVLPRGRDSSILSPEEFILPEAFKARQDLGYALAHIGKWHVSRGVNDPNLYGWPYYAGPDPERSGLDGLFVWGSSYFYWTKYVNGISTSSTTYATTDQINEALGVIRQARKQGRPYFLELAFNAAHTPYHKPANDLHSQDALPEYPSLLSRFRVGLSNIDLRLYFEAMVEALDTEIGRLLKEVDLTTTTVIFLGDNGTAGEVVAAPYSKDKAKGTLYQEGIQVPLLIAGAGVVSPGRIVEEIVNTVDLFPTILELAGIDMRTTIPSGTKIDGVSIVPYIQDQTSPALRQWIYAEKFRKNYDHNYQRAIRNAGYKLIERANGSREFYDMVRDPLEITNLLQSTLTDLQEANLESLDAQLDALLASR
jgi:arylsulfatase A-like enzyme